MPLLNGVKRINSREISTILGQTVDFLFIDLREDFVPNKINILLEAVRGGGVIFILGLPYSEWIYSVNQKQDSIEKGSSTEIKRRKSIFLSWFYENLKNNTQCNTKKVCSTEVIASFKPMPYNINLAAHIKDILVTIEQKKVINGLNDIFFDSTNSNSCTTLLANRGRGKSASIGLFISQVLSKISKRTFTATISSPHPTNVQVLFDFLSRGLISENIKFRKIKQEGLVSGIYTSSNSNSKITYIWPSEIKTNLKTDLFVVDEAAAIPIEILKKITKISAKKIFLSTIHGYEGAGRGFQHKFLHYLRKQKQINYIEYNLTQPIRYMKGDSIEKLLNHTFLLDVELEPLKVDSRSIERNTLKLQVHKDPKYLFSKDGLPHLKQLFSLLIYAHYRNQPNDLIVLADSGKHFLAGVYGKDNQKNELLLVSSQLAEEGMMKSEEIQEITSGKFIKGNLISTISIRHFSEKLAKLRGLRVVRIAVHPSLIDKGFGRLAIELQDQIFSSYEWIGVSYGATVKLMKFWRKFNFVSVHIRPIKTLETGEWNIIVIRPLGPSAKDIISQASADFLLQFIALLKQSIHSMKPELVVQILKSCNPIPDYKPKITSSGTIRLKNYLKGHLNFLLAVDVIYELTVKYFVSPQTIKLSPSQEALLITRILQGRTWGQTLSKTGLKWKTANSLLEKAVAKIAQEYF
ncbi:MAG: tRNA(Met) cytidine acetyltransferase [Candidatus Heimdallarchaeota archaeon]|nr:MAG: tRNA(Met) cytidine acetyltransferase [Candidatus Heimdallarchaeota archaeon]